MQKTNKIQPKDYSDLMKASVFVTDHTGQKCNMGNMALSLLQRKGPTCGKRGSSQDPAVREAAKERRAAGTSSICN